MAEERRIFEIKCKFYGIEATKLIPGDMPFCVNPASGQWYTEDKRKIETPPSHVRDLFSLGFVYLSYTFKNLFSGTHPGTTTTYVNRSE